MNGKDKKVFVQKKLATSKAWAVKALLTVYANQTSDEMVSKHTRYINGRGFSSTDARILSSFAEQVNKGRQLSDKQLGVIFKLMPKYWQQILNACSPEKLDSVMKVTTN